MQPLHVEFTLTVKDYRNAVYFGTTLRHRRAIMIFFVVAALTAIASAGGYFGLWPFYQFPLFIAFAYLIWFILLLGQIERSILRYSKTKDNLLGKRCVMDITDEKLQVAFPAIDVKYSLGLDTLMIVFETSRFFNIYMDPLHTVILPHTALSQQQRDELRSLFDLKLGTRFDTRFGTGASANQAFGKHNRKGFFGSRFF
jgi:hypothetical protein